MNTIHSENEKNLTTAINYYSAMCKKDFDTMINYLHDDVHFISPLGELRGKDAVSFAAKNFAGMLQDMQIKSQFANGNQIMLTYDVILHEPIGKFRSATLMEFTDQLISKIELFYDARPFEQKS